MHDVHALGVVPVLAPSAAAFQRSLLLYIHQLGRRPFNQTQYKNEALESTSQERPKRDRLVLHLLLLCAVALPVLSTANLAPDLNGNLWLQLLYERTLLMV